MEKTICETEFCAKKLNFLQLEINGEMFILLCFKVSNKSIDKRKSC